MDNSPIVMEIGAGVPDSAIIWLHGLGADGHDFEAIVPELRLPDSLNIRFVFPHAPMRPVTINNGFVMRAWYDIRAMDIAAEQDELGIRESEELLRGLIDEQLAAGIPADRIVLAGFSQGGAIILHTGLRYEKPLAGLMALSTYLPLSASVPEERNDANLAVPIFTAHGREDTVIPVALARHSQDILKRLGYEVESEEYIGMGHSVCFEEAQHIHEWIIQRFG